MGSSRGANKASSSSSSQSPSASAQDLRTLRLLAYLLRNDVPEAGAGGLLEGRGAGASVLEGRAGAAARGYDSSLSAALQQRDNDDDDDDDDDKEGRRCKGVIITATQKSGVIMDAQGSIAEALAAKVCR